MNAIRWKGNDSMAAYRQPLHYGSSTCDQFESDRSKEMVVCEAYTNIRTQSTTDLHRSALGRGRPGLHDLPRRG